jgi:hypothetical protein
VLCGFLLYDLCVMCIIPESAGGLLVAGLAVALVVGSLIVIPRSARRRPSALVLAPALVLAAALGAWGIHALRDGWRNRFLKTRLDLHPFPRHWVKGWAFCDDPQETKTIALASYEPDFGHHWFFYPLMGRRLQNRVVYVPADPTKGGIVHCLDFGTWKADLEQVGVTHVFVQLNPDLPLDDRRREPVEMGWIRARPDVFALLDQGDHYRVYRILSLDTPGH